MIGVIMGENSEYYVCWHGCAPCAKCASRSLGVSIGFCEIHKCLHMILADDSTACHDCMMQESPLEQMERMHSVYINAGLFDFKIKKLSLWQRIWSRIK